jgi:ADP-ribose pyrophosphatase YjhB (NUDIX family)
MNTSENSKAKFTFRVVGIALDKNRVLLHKAEKDDFWALPGGHVELREQAEDALKREMKEEIGVEIQVKRLVWVVENFFEYEDTPYHELGLYFLIDLPSDSNLYDKNEPFIGYEEGVKLIFQWHSLNDLENTPLYPTFLQKGLKSIPENIEHIVHIDTK